jgi:hypothetical protein
MRGLNHEVYTLYGEGGGIRTRVSYARLEAGARLKILSENLCRLATDKSLKIF